MSTTYDNIFKKASETYGVDINLIKAVAKTESGYNPSATSSAGAQGIMQLMPTTATGLGVTNAYDPEQNIMGGTNYLSQMLSKYNGDVKSALASYNAGSKNVSIYGKEKYSSYYTKVLNNYNEIAQDNEQALSDNSSLNDTISSNIIGGSTSSTTATSGVNSIIKVVLIILILFVALFFIGMSIKGYSVKETIEKVV